MRRIYLFIAAVVSVFAMTSCDKNDKYCYPIQTEEDGRWGLMTPDGKVVFEDEFDEIEYVAVNGFFKVKNKDGLWEIYTAKKKPEQVGREYKYVSPFCNGIALATEKDKPITLINTKGKVIKTLDELSGKIVVNASTFVQGLSIFGTDEELYGVINTKGDVILEPKYAGILIGKGLMVAVTKKDKGKNFPHFIIFNHKGKELCTINGMKEKIDGIELSDGKLIVRINRENESYKYGIMNTKGEWIMKPHKKAKVIRDVWGDNVIFYDGDNCGVMNTDGEIVLRAKYDYLWFRSKNILIAHDSKEGEEMLIDLEGNQIGNEAYQDLRILDDKYLAAQEDEHSWVVIDNKGNVVSDKKLDIYDINFRTDNNDIKTDYVDISKLIAYLNITKDGVDGLSLSDKAKSIATKVAEKKDSDTDLDPENYRYDDVLYYEKHIGMAEASIKFSFDEYIGEPITETTYETYYGWVYSHERTVGYKFRDITPASYTITFYNSGILTGKTEKIYDALCKEAKRYGSVSGRSTDKATLVSIDSGHSILVAIDDDGKVIFRNIMRDASAVYHDNLTYEEEEVAVDSVAIDDVLADTIE